MSNYSKILLKMNTYLHNVYTYFEQVVHPAGGKSTADKRKKRNTASAIFPRATPDSMNIRDLYKRQDGFRRNPAP
jgi:hypothetical protein